MDPPNYQLGDLIRFAIERLTDQRELRAVVVDLLGFMAREQPGSDGYYYEIKRRAELVRDLIEPDAAARLHDKRLAARAG